MTDKTMTLEQVRDALRKIEASDVGLIRGHLVSDNAIKAWADAITRHISQPSESGEAVDRVAKAIADAAGHGMREKCEHMAHAAIAAYRLATWPETSPPPAAGAPYESVASFVEKAGEIIGGKPFPSGQSLAKAREICDLAMTMLSANPSPIIDVAAVREVISDLREWGKTDAQLEARAEELARAIGDAK